MSQQATMTMANMGGPVNAINPNTPNHAAALNTDPAEYVKRLNTYIYDYFVRNGHYECARTMVHEGLPIGLHSKSSPGQRQANGMDDMDLEKDVDRPKDLPLTDLPPSGGHFLEDWWFQFWDVFNSRRSGQGKAATIAYLSHQRQLQKARSGLTADPSGQRNFSMVNGQGSDLKKMAMVNNGNMNPAAVAAMRARQAQLQSGQMERSASQMDAHSGSPGSGGAPSPKRPRVDGSMQPMSQQQRPGQPGQMPNQGMPHNAAAGLQAGPQGSPMPQGGMDLMNMNESMRQSIMQNNGVNMNAQQGGANANGSHALQDYQMQLMLLEQQNKRRLQMARSDQETMNGHTGVPAANGQFPPNMSPSGRGASPNPNDMSRGTPKMSNGPSPNGLAGRGSPAPNYDPNMLNALQQQRNQLMIVANGQLIPRSSPMGPAQMEALRVQQAGGQMLPNGTFPGGPGMPMNMMPGQPVPQPGQVPPNMTPRQGNMAPPPAPQPNAAGTQPSSPAPAVAPPTPSQTNKAKPGAKKDNKANKGSNKKNANTTAATPASEAEQPPTPTPQTPMNNGKNFNPNQAAAMASGGMPNGQVNGGMQQPGVMQPGQPDMGMPPFNMEGEPFVINDFSMENSHDVLDNFDFDAFLQNTGDDGGMAGFDYDFTNVGGVEAGDSGI